MKGLFIASQNVRALFAAAALAVGLSACGNGNGGTTGAAGTGGPCDPTVSIFPTVSASAPDGRGCAIPGCHAKATAVSLPAGNFDMETPGWQTTIVGKVPPGGGGKIVPDGGMPDGGPDPLRSLCVGMNKVYLVAGSAPATGLFIEKLTQHVPSCGAPMPNIGSPLSATEIACVQNWANALTKP